MQELTALYLIIEGIKSEIKSSVMVTVSEFLEL